MAFAHGKLTRSAWALLRSLLPGCDAFADRARRCEAGPTAGGRHDRPTSAYFPGRQFPAGTGRDIFSILIMT